jgi:thiosulfate/3-mercaptopyruvate sulfurtransferase
MVQPVRGKGKLGLARNLIMSRNKVPLLVESDWLENNLHDPHLRIVDCTVHISYDNSTGGLEAESGLDDWRKSHIPKSVFVDILNDLSKTENQDYTFQLPEADVFRSAMEAAGIGDDTLVVAYDTLNNAWAARFWWMLRVFGHQQAGVLNGGWERWTTEGRPVSSEADNTPTVRFTPEFQLGLVANKQDINEHVANPVASEISVINALRPDDYKSLRIPNTENVPSVGESGVVDTETNMYLPVDEMKQRFDAARTAESKKVITYCGAGIAASSAAFVAYASGIEDIAVYDGSLEEWRSDPDLPVESDQ